MPTVSERDGRVCIAVAVEVCLNLLVARGPDRADLARLSAPGYVGADEAEDIVGGDAVPADLIAGLAHLRWL